MTSLTFDHRSTPRLLRGLRLGRPAPAAPRPPRPPVTGTVRGCLRLALRDGVQRLYLLDPRDFAATTSPEVAYDARVHAAYLLTLQGHRPEWLAQHLDLPVAAVHHIAAQAWDCGPEGPGPLPPGALSPEV